MINAKLILPVVLALATSFTGVSAATSTETRDTDIRSAISVQCEEALSEKLESGELSREKYDEIIAAIEAGEFRGTWGNIAMRGKRGNAVELTEEQKAELAEKWLGVSENGRFGGMWVNRGNAKELTDEQKTEIAEKQAEAAANGNFGGFRGGMRGNFGSRNK